MELTKQKNYHQVFDLACQVIEGMDRADQAKKAGGVYRSGENTEQIELHFFGEPYTIGFPGVHFSNPEKKVVSLVTRILLLHYLIRADGHPFTGKAAAYQDLPGGLLYAGVFGRRVTSPLARKFGKSARWFANIGLQFGGKSAGVGDASFRLAVLPRVVLQYVLWEGDDEFPPSVQLLFDTSIMHYLSLEDIVVLGQLATGRLIHLSKASSEG